MSNRTTFLLIVVLVICSRIPFKSTEIFHTDSLGLSLGALYAWTAHPPGFIGYNALGRLFYYFIGDINNSFVWLNILCTALAAGFVFLLGQAIYSRKTGLIACLLFSSSILTLYFSDIALTYAAEGFFATLYAFAAWKALQNRDWRWYLLGTIILAAGGSVRQTTLAFLFPLWLFVTWHSARSWGMRLLGLIILVASVSGWAIPNAHFLEMYWEKGQRGYLAGMYKLQVAMEQYYDPGTIVGDPVTFENEARYHWPLVEVGVAIYNFVRPPTATAPPEVRKASLSKALRLIGYQAFKLSLYTVFGLGVAALALVFLFIKSIRRAFAADGLKVAFFSLWIVPAALFFVLGHLGSWGYLLIFFGAVIVICVRLFEMAQEADILTLHRRNALFGCTVLASAAFFALARPLPETNFTTNLLNIAFFQYTGPAIRQHFARARAGLAKEDPRQLPIECVTTDCLLKNLPVYFQMDNPPPPAPSLARPSGR